MQSEPQPGGDGSHVAVKSGKARSLWAALRSYSWFTVTQVPAGCRNRYANPGSNRVNETRSAHRFWRRSSLVRSSIPSPGRLLLRLEQFALPESQPIQPVLPHGLDRLDAVLGAAAE